MWFSVLFPYLWFKHHTCFPIKYVPHAFSMTLNLQTGNGVTQRQAEYQLQLLPQPLTSLNLLVEYPDHTSWCRTSSIHLATNFHKVVICRFVVGLVVPAKEERGSTSAKAVIKTVSAERQT